jgi:hypothetical protein
MLSDADMVRLFTPSLATHRLVHEGREFGRSKRADLEWWLSVAPTQPWRWAPTYAHFSPHWYLPPEFSTLSQDEYVRAVYAINTWGQPGIYMSRTNIYLEGALPPSPDPTVYGLPESLPESRLPSTLPRGRMKWFTGGFDENALGGKPVMDRLVNSLINMAALPDPFDYNPSRRPALPVTSHPSGRDWPTDYAGLSWDVDHPLDPEVGLALRAAMRDLFGATAPTVLDVGAGTGRALDYRVTAPLAYTALEPSQGMLNRLVCKYPKVAHVVPFSVDEVKAQPDPSFWLGARSFDAVLLLDTAPSLSLGEMAWLRTLGRKVIIMQGRHVAVADGTA